MSDPIEHVIDKVTAIAMHASQEVGSIGGAILTLRLAAEMLEGELRSHGDTPELRAFEALRPLMEEAGRAASKTAQRIHAAKVQS